MFIVKFAKNTKLSSKDLPPGYVTEFKYLELNEKVPEGWDAVTGDELDGLLIDRATLLAEHLRDERAKQKEKDKADKVERGDREQATLDAIEKERRAAEQRTKDAAKLLKSAEDHLSNGKNTEAILALIKYLRTDA